MTADLGGQVLGHSGREVKLGAGLRGQVRRERGLGESWRLKRFRSPGLAHSLIP